MLFDVYLPDQGAGGTAATDGVKRLGRNGDAPASSRIPNLPTWPNNKTKISPQRLDIAQVDESKVLHTNLS